MQDATTPKRKRGRPRGSGQKSSSNMVVALDRGLVVLKAIADCQNTTLSDLALHVDMPPSSVHRILATLQSHRFVDFDTMRQEWAVGIGAFKVGSNYLSRTNLIETSQVILRDLMSQTGETANLGIADAGKVVFVSQVETQNPIRAMFRQGTGSPKHASGIGKALLAVKSKIDVAKFIEKYGQKPFTPYTLINLETLCKDLDLISQRGWAIDNQERYTGMRCVAAAVYNAQGQTIAGVSVSGPTARFTDEVVEQFGPVVVAAADRLTEITGGQKPTQQT